MTHPQTISSGFLSAKANSARKLAVAALCVLLTTTAGAQGAEVKASLQQTLESARRNAMTAWQKKDMDSLKAIMAPDFLFVSPQGVAPREGWLGSLAHCSLASYTLDQVQVHPISAETAIMIYNLHYVGACDGTPVSPDSVVTDTFARREGKWWIVNTTYMPRPI